MPADVYELGLIYRIDIADDRSVSIEMTLTTPNCPSAQELPTMVENAVASVPGVGQAKVDIVGVPGGIPHDVDLDLPYAGDAGDPVLHHALQFLRRGTIGVRERHLD